MDSSYFQSWVQLHIPTRSLLMHFKIKSEEGVSDIGSNARHFTAGFIDFRWQNSRLLPCLFKAGWNNVHAKLTPTLVLNHIPKSTHCLLIHASVSVWSLSLTSWFVWLLFSFFFNRRTFSYNFFHRSFRNEKRLWHSRILYFFQTKIGLAQFSMLFKDLEKKAIEKSKTFPEFPKSVWTLLLFCLWWRTES